MNIKKWTLVFCLAVPALAALGAGQVVEEIVAVVNDDVITLSQVKAQHDIYYQQLRAQYQGEEFEKQYARFKAELINSMITDILLLQQAREKQLNVMEQVKMNIDAIKKENNMETDEDLRRALQGQGITMEAFTKQMEENILKEAILYREVYMSIVVDDAEVAQYYKLNPAQFTDPEEYKLKAVYLSFEGRTEEAIEKLKKEISDKLKAGEEFAAVAAESADSPMKEAKGELGDFKKGQLDKSLEDAVSPLKKGETSAWIKAKNGWYLIRMEDKKESRLKAFEEVKQAVMQKLGDERRAKKANEYIKKLKEISYIKILKPNPFDGN
jgi:parvulin-like peptidyl-prolyl isomerase